MARGAKDKYANILNARIIAGGNGAVSSEVATGVSLGEGKGMLIDQIDYFMENGMITDLVAAAVGEYYQMSWSVQSDEFGYNNSRVIHQFDVVKWDDGTAGNSHIVKAPKVFQFFPPMIVASPKLFFNGLGSASIDGGAVNARMYFRYVELSTQEYLELAEAFVLMS